jgi:serine/threonine-protein kinase HipA
MATGKIDILVYADWFEISGPKLLGTLAAHQGKGRKAFSFSYDEKWLETEKPLLFDPDITWNKGQQFPIGKSNFGIFNDAMPDTWGRNFNEKNRVSNC